MTKANSATKAERTFSVIELDWQPAKSETTRPKRAMAVVDWDPDVIQADTWSFEAHNHCTPTPCDCDNMNPMT